MIGWLAVLAIFGLHRAVAGTDRDDMVDSQIRNRGVTDAGVLDAMRSVPREEFVPPDMRHRAHQDAPLAIGHGQTISQPYIVALMTELLALKPDSRVLEVGTGSGYQAAILGQLAADVYSVEIIEPLAKSARQTLERLGYKNVHVRAGDGYEGWPEAAPFDAIIVTCAPDHVPQPLIDQLRDGGRLVIPVGETGGVQGLYLLKKTGSGIEKKSITPVRFVPLTRPADP